MIVTFVTLAAAVLMALIASLAAADRNTERMMRRRVPVRHDVRPDHRRR